MTLTWPEGTEPSGATDALRWQRLRYVRDELLRDSDWTMGPDAPVDVAAWVAYRQALRDLTSQPDPNTAVWPVRPPTTGSNANRDTIRAQALTALDTNRTFIARGASNTAVQVRDEALALARQNNGIIRLLLNQLEGIN